MANSAFSTGGSGTGTVTSVGIESDSLVVNNSPITNSGVIDIELPGSLTGKNMILNGDMRVFQKGIPSGSGTNIQAIPPNTTTYCIDRFQIQTPPGVDVLISQQPTSANNAGWFVTIQRSEFNAGVGDIKFCTSLTRDMCLEAAGKQATISVKLRAGGNYSAAGGILNLKLVSGEDATDISVLSGFTNAVNVIDEDCVIVPGGTFTFTSSVITANMTQLAAVCTFSCLGIAGGDDSFSIEEFKIEVGDKATPFLSSPNAEVLPKLLYFRYIPKCTVPQIFGTGFAINNINGNVWIPFHTAMRVPPILTVDTVPGHYYIMNGNGNQAGNVTNIAQIATTINGCRVHVTTTGGLTVGQGTMLAALSPTFLDFNAELV